MRCLRFFRPRCRCLENELVCQSGMLCLRLNLLQLSTETSYHTFDSVLELLVLGGVDERIDTETGKCVK